MKKNKNRLLLFLKNNDNKILIIGSIIFELIIYILTPYLEYNAKTIISLLFLCILSIFLILNNKKTYKKNIFYLIFILGLLLRTIYILYTSAHIRQHDVLALNEEGHLGYIYTLFKTYRLPTTNTWQFYHPPAWHILGAIWLKINELLKMDLLVSIEGIQIITTLLSSFIILIVDKINIKLNIKNKYRYLIDLMFAIHPALIILSGSINNDCLLIFLEFLTILLLINWHNLPDIKNTIYLAITTGLCVMTKANGALIAVPILYIFINKFIYYLKNNKKQIKQFISKIITFGIISLPIGLWFQIRSLVLFSKTEIPSPGDWLYTGNHSIISRFININLKELFHYANMDKDYNIPSFIIKSSLFGEYSFNNLSNIIKYTLLITNIILIIISTIFIIKYIFNKKKNIYINTLIITWISTLISMIIFNYKYPYACSMDFRYIEICLLTGIIMLNYSNDNTKLRKVINIIQYIFISTSILFIFMI